MRLDLWVSFGYLLCFTSAETWPYNRFYAREHEILGFVPDTTKPEFDSDPKHHFLAWLRGVVKKDVSGELQKIFKNQSIPHHVTSADGIVDHVALPAISVAHENRSSDLNSGVEGLQLFNHLPYPVEQTCMTDKNKYWYRTIDGTCNYLFENEYTEGAVGTAKSRDYNQHYYADGISTPREGPNPRAVSNAFFKRKKALYYEHTPLLLGLIEFIIHDISYSQDSTTEHIDVAMPDDEEVFPMNTTMRVSRTAAVPGTGTSQDNPREILNMATTWLDLSQLYGSTVEVADALRSFVRGKLLTQELQTRGTKSKASYLPFNTKGVPTRTRPGLDPTKLFAGGDARTNEDWMLLGVHTLMIREHNRLCDILANQHPDYDDERLYQTIRLAMGAKYQMIANAYQMAYWTEAMPWPRDDGFPLFRALYGKNVLEMNPANTYPWPLVTKGGKPMIASAEMAIVYRFHDFIIPSFSIKDATNNTLWEQDLFATGFDASGFIDAGLENVLRGMVSSHIPNFHSGVDEGFRSARLYRGMAFDVATWSVVHEREQGLPTFNNYFREYNKQDPAVPVPIREHFSDFSSDPEMVASLERLYQTPSDVDLVVGVQLDEEMFPGTTVPKSALITSLFSLFGMGLSDRFSNGYTMMRCLLVDKPWDCHPSTALEELLWSPRNVSGFPNFRFYDDFWMGELDLQAHGENLLWRLVTENTEIDCLQFNPLFPMDPITNPVMCALPVKKMDLADYVGIGVSQLEVVLALVRQHRMAVATTAAAVGVGLFALWKRLKSKSKL